MGEDAGVPDVPLRGRLLVAAPPLVDPNFDRTVVLMLEHGTQGALGLVLNRAGDTPLKDAVPEWASLASPPAVLFTGGPVSPSSVIALARSDVGDEREGWVPIANGVGTVDLGRAPEEVPVVVEGVRVFLGYAGWAPGQLEEELARDAWFVVDFETTDAFADEPEGLWRLVLRRQRGSLAMFANAPADPATN
jgi:putative transcriptional regulator